MNIQFENLKNIKSILDSLFPKLELEKSELDKNSIEKLIYYLIYIIDALLKAENLYQKRNFSLDDGVSFFNRDIIGTMKNIGSYLFKFNSRVFGFTKTERQTFIFILDNIIDYYKSQDFFSEKNEKKDVFGDYKFWIENFLKIVDQKIKGSVVRGILSDKFRGACEENAVASLKNTVSGTNPDEFFFINAKVNLPLYPFLIWKNNQWLFLHDVNENELSYKNIITDQSQAVNNETLDLKVFEFLFSNFDFKNANMVKKRIPGKGNILIENASVIENANNFNQNKLFMVSSNLLNEIAIEKMELPLLYLLQIRNMFELEKYFELKRLLQKFVLFFPYYPDGYKILGEVYIKEENYELAYNSFEKVLNLVQDKKVAETMKTLKEEIEKSKRKIEPRSGDSFYDITEFMLQKNEKIIAREKELRQMIEVLISPSRSNVLLIGDSGVGKTALIQLLAQKILDGEVPDWLKEKKVKEINFVALLTGSKYRGQFEEKALKILNDFKLQNAILVLEDIHLMMSSGASRGTSLDLVNILKQFLRESSIQVIATTTYEEYKNSVEKDNSLMGFLQKISVNELSIENTRKILENMAGERLEKDNILISRTIISDIVESAKRYIKEKKLPDAAVMVFERSISKRKLKNSYGGSSRSEINQTDLLEVISDILNLPETSISITLKNRLATLKDSMTSSIIGQNEAIDRVVSNVLTSKLNLDVKNNRPDGVFLFVGPTGVGKTETAIALSKALYGSEDYLIRIDMSEYMEKFTYSRFIGAAPGYVGYYDTNQLTDKVRQNPFSVILLDEFEKADSQLLNIFLQVFDAGRLTDARGNAVDFSHSTIIMTSNIGTDLFSKSQLGYQGDLDGADVSRTALIKSLKRFFSPEFLNRIDEIVVFKHLELNDIKKIIDIQLQEVRGNLEKQGKELILKDEVFDFIIKKYYSKEYGARNISRALKFEILEKIAAASLQKEWSDSHAIVCCLNKERIDIQLEFENTSAMGSEEMIENASGK
jgi:ATP-dependent Clp protease ATP-binding subunit ClpC